MDNKLSIRAKILIGILVFIIIGSIITLIVLYLVKNGSTNTGIKTSGSIQSSSSEEPYRTVTIVKSDYLIPNVYKPDLLNALVPKYRRYTHKEPLPSSSEEPTSSEEEALRFPKLRKITDQEPNKRESRKLNESLYLASNGAYVDKILASVI